MPTQHAHATRNTHTNTHMRAHARTHTGSIAWSWQSNAGVTLTGWSRSQITYESPPAASAAVRTTSTRTLPSTNYPL
jgi:hypothetical protein